MAPSPAKISGLRRKLTDQQKIKLASLVLRIGLAAVFLYAAVDAFITPDAWIGYMPAFISHIMSLKLALDLVSISQLVLVGWLLSGKLITYAAVISMLLLGGILVTNPATILITFRDIGLIATALGLGVLEY